MSALSELSDIEFVKGHGTRNDFVLFADPDDAHELTPAQVRALADRRAGLGADGVIRAVRRDGRWFMDYRNADGSLAEMCGNGARVFSEYLVAEHLIDRPAAGEPFSFGTVGGVRRAFPDPLGWAIDMGQGSFPGGDDALAVGSDVQVGFAGGATVAGLRVAMPNPHVVVALRSPSEVEALDLTAAPHLDPALPQGANVEAVAVVDAEPPTLFLRVYERGAGETPSCGTGVCAAVLAVRAWAGDGAADEWQVIVPGGRLVVQVAPDGVRLVGPAELTYRARLSAIRTSSTR